MSVTKKSCSKVKSAFVEFHKRRDPKNRFKRDLSNLGILGPPAPAVDMEVVNMELCMCGMDFCNGALKPQYANEVMISIIGFVYFVIMSQFF